MPLSDYFPEMEGWTKVEPTEAPIAPEIPDKTTTVNPYLRTTQPIILQYASDTMRQYNRPGLSSYRVAPLAPNASAVTQAATASTSAIVAKQVTKGQAITTAGLTMPPQYSVGSSPLTPPGGTIAVQWNPVPSGQVLQGPPPGFTGFQGASYGTFASFIGPSKTVSTSFTPQSQTSLLIYGENPTLGHSVSLSQQGWTAFGVSNFFFKTVNGFTPVIVSGLQGQQTQTVSLIAGFSGTPALVQQTSGNTLQGSATLGGVTAGDTILIGFNIADNSPAITPTVAVSDNQGNAYQLIASNIIAGTNSGAAPSGVLSSLFLFATTAGSGGTLTTSWIIGYGGSTTPSFSTPIIFVAEFGALPTGPGLPSFGPLNPTALPTLNIANLAGILPPKSGGTGANLSANGGPGKILFEAVVGGPISVASYLTPVSQSVSFTAAYQNLYLINTSSGSVNVVLPTAGGNPSAVGAQIAFKKISSDANFVNLVAASGQTIDGGATASFNQQFTTLTLESDGTNWWIV